MTGGDQPSTAKQFNNSPVKRDTESEVYTGRFEWASLPNDKTMVGIIWSELFPTKLTVTIFIAYISLFISQGK